MYIIYLQISILGGRILLAMPMAGSDPGGGAKGAPLDPS